MLDELLQVCASPCPNDPDHFVQIRAAQLVSLSQIIAEDGQNTRGKSLPGGNELVPSRHFVARRGLFEGLLDGMGRLRNTRDVEECRVSLERMNCAQLLWQGIELVAPDLFEQPAGFPKEFQIAGPVLHD